MRARVRKGAAGNTGRGHGVGKGRRMGNVRESPSTSTAPGSAPIGGAALRSLLLGLSPRCPQQPPAHGHTPSAPCLTSLDLPFPARCSLGPVPLKQRVPSPGFQVCFWGPASPLASPAGGRKMLFLEPPHCSGLIRSKWNLTAVQGHGAWAGGQSAVAPVIQRGLFSGEQPH